MLSALLTAYRDPGALTRKQQAARARAARERDEKVRKALERLPELEQIKAKLADTAIKERGKKELFAAEQRIKMMTGSGI